MTRAFFGVQREALDEVFQSLLFDNRQRPDRALVVVSFVNREGIAFENALPQLLLDHGNVCGAHLPLR